MAVILTCALGVNIDHQACDPYGGCEREGRHRRGGEGREDGGPVAILRRR